MIRPSILPRAFAETRERIADLGMNLWGIANLEEFDAALCRGKQVGERKRDARSVVVIGAGGSSFFHAAASGEGSAACADAMNDRAREILTAEAERLREAGHDVTAIFPFDPNPTCFAQMAEAAGLVVASPVVNLLLHPDYGPWVTLCGALVVGEELESSGELDFDPCSSCAAPCLSACPVGTFPDAGHVELDRCATHRHRGGCAAGCEVRRACPCGAEMRFDEQHEQALQAARLPLLRRVFGHGIWRFVPSFIRRRPFVS